MFQKTIGAVFFAGMISGVQANPLHPSYFAKKANAPMIDVSAGRSYVDSRNPLYPMFGHDGEWQTTGLRNVTHYIDNRNPLHPSFRRK